MYIYKNLVITIEHYIKFIISKTLKLELKKKKKKKKKKAYLSLTQKMWANFFK